MYFANANTRQHFVQVSLLRFPRVSRIENLSVRTQRRTKARWRCAIETKHTHANKQTYNQFQLAGSERERTYC
jgi:hypothetical protein